MINQKHPYHEIKIKRLMSPQTFLVYEHLYLNGPSTTMKVCECFLKENKVSHTVRTVITNLVKLGCVERTANTVYCEVTKRQVFLFAVTDKLPLKPIKNKTKTQIMRDLEKRLMDAEKVMSTCWQLTNLVKDGHHFQHELNKYRTSYPEVLKHAKTGVRL